MESTTPTYSKIEEGRSNYTSKSTHLMQGGDRAWSGREKRLKILHYSQHIFLKISHYSQHDLLEGSPYLRRWAKCRRALHRRQSPFLIMSLCNGSEQSFRIISLSRPNKVFKTGHDRTGHGQVGGECTEQDFSRCIFMP